MNDTTLAGIDVIDLTRVPPHRPGWSDVFRRTVLADGEGEWASSETELLTCFSAKESLVKAVGAKPPDFSWRDVALGQPELLHGTDPALSSAHYHLAPSLEELVRQGFGIHPDSSGDAPPVRAGCSLRVDESFILTVAFVSVEPHSGGHAL